MKRHLASSLVADNTTTDGTAADDKFADKASWLSTTVIAGSGQFSPIISITSARTKGSFSKTMKLITQTPNTKPFTTKVRWRSQ